MVLKERKKKPQTTPAIPALEAKLTEKQFKWNAGEKRKYTR